MTAEVKQGDFLFSKSFRSNAKVIEVGTLWGSDFARIWLSTSDAVVRVPVSDLSSINSQFSALSKDHIAYVAAAAKVAEVLEGSTSATDGHVLLAPMESNVIPLPHQIHALSRAISGESSSPDGLRRSGCVRYLLADEVGLGKTIEAGLVMRELKLRGQVLRTLVVTPKSLAMQWVAEMATHFNESFALVNPGDLDALERLESPSWLENETKGSAFESNPWLKFPQAIVTLDSVKPVTRRKGWSKEKIQAYNMNRYERLVQGQWDLIIVDESHRLGGSTEQVARYKLGQGLAEAAPHLLLLSATPHQGKSDAFQRLMSLLDPMAFPDLESVTRERVSDFVIRTEKRKAVTADGKPLFRPRTTQTINVDLNQNPSQVALYDAVTDYVRKGYNRAIKDRKPHVGFLMVLLQRIVTSSTHAIRCTLERRLQALKDLKETTRIPSEEDLDEFTDLDGQLQLDLLVEINEPGRIGEMSEVEDLLQLAKLAETSGPDVKTESLMHLIFELQGKENDDQLKLLIFTEFIPTQAMLRNFLEERGIPCTTLNGSMNMDERRLAQREFRDNARVLIATDAGGEGLNLQFCHVVINYDLPWNPMRIEQRIGRVDRIGQSKAVRATNFVYENSVESRVREVLESKLAVILSELGIDKANDILDTGLAGDSIERMITSVVMEGKDPDQEVEKAIFQLNEEVHEIRSQCAVYNISEEPNLAVTEELRNHPLPHWIERMTLSYLRENGGKADENLFGWNLEWPDGKSISNAVFQSRDLNSDGNLLSLENPRVRGIAMNLPEQSEGQSVGVVSVPGLPDGISGAWGLFEVSMVTQKPTNSQIRISLSRKAYLSIFIDEQGRRFLPTARAIWDALQTNDCEVKMSLDLEQSSILATKLHEAVEESGQQLFHNLQQAHKDAIHTEQERGRISFEARRRAIQRIGLPEVRQHRLNKCGIEEKVWLTEIESVREAIPDIRTLLILKIDQGLNR